MLAKIEPARADFMALACYLMTSKETPPNPDRVAWLFAHNLHTDDPEHVAQLMAATAAQSVRCAAPCYHLSINWDPVERPDPEIMQEVALKTLAMAGLGEHQALVVGHGDTTHRHLHMMINRVHPDTGKAWATSHDYRRFDRIMKQLADEYGFTHAPCHRFDPEETADLPKGPTSRATRAARRGANTNRPQWSVNDARAYGARVSEHLDAGSGHTDLDQMFAEDGLRLEAKGKGYVVGNGASYVKLSALGLEITANGLARRRPPRRGVPRASGKAAPTRPWVDAIDIAKALAVIGLADTTDVRAAIQDARGQRMARLARRPLIEQLMAELKLAWASTTAARPPPRRRRPSPNRKPNHSREAPAR